jgi:hypothetical protein
MESVVGGSECGRGRERGGLPGDVKPQTYIRGPNIHKHHVRIGATRTRPMSSVTEFASRSRFCASCIMLRHVCQACFTH